jgi:hypothetical protein
MSTGLSVGVVRTIWFSSPKTPDVPGGESGLVALGIASPPYRSRSPPVVDRGVDGAGTWVSSIKAGSTPEARDRPAATMG